MVGRELTYEVLRAISPLTEAALQQELTKLVEAELLYQRGRPPQATYLFKHALVQETAYQSLLKSKRQQYHRQLAEVFEARFPETTATQPELVAHHYTEAGLVAQAIPYWQRAGERAVQRSANAEAITHLTKGLELLAALPDSPERSRQELTLRTTLGPALITTKGNAALEVEQTYIQAVELCRQVGETSHLFPVLFGLRSVYLVRREVQRAHELGEQLLSLAKNVQDTDLLIEAHLALGNTLLLFGEFIPAQAQCEQVLALYNPQRHRSHAVLYGLDPGVFCLSRIAWLLCFLGYRDQALEKIRDTLTLAQELSHPFSSTIGLMNTALVHGLRQEGQAAQKWAEAGITLCTEQGFTSFVGLGAILRGWALAEQGQVEEGIAQIRQGLATCRATGVEMCRSWWLAMLAGACGKAERVEEGLNVVAEALAFVDKTGERMWAAELYRLKGELALAQSSVQSLGSSVQKEAEECFLKAIEIARKQQAKSLELRAVMSLSRLWQHQSKKEEARQILAEIYGWFTEGFDTKDLQEARALLEELS